jgi:hypothetical protein
MKPSHGLGASAMQRLSIGGAEEGGDLSSLEAYPDISLDRYVDDGNFWHINKTYPGQVRTPSSF